ncbi:MAG: hypothetical protein RRY99_00420 [Flavobacterium sp.]
MRISKRKKKEFFISIFSILFITIIFLNLKRLQVKFYNKTGEDIDSLIIGETLIGHLKNENSTQKINFKEFTFNDNIPYEQINGIVNNKKLDQLNWSSCGTGIETKSKGWYQFDIKKTLDKNGNTCLYLVEHNKKIFWEEE